MAERPDADALPEGDHVEEEHRDAQPDDAGPPADPVAREYRTQPAEDDAEFPAD
jgi:hypothetical protein